MRKESPRKQEFVRVRHRKWPKVCGRLARSRKTLKKRGRRRERRWPLWPCARVIMCEARLLPPPSPFLYEIREEYATLKQNQEALFGICLEQKGFKNSAAPLTCLPSSSPPPHLCMSFFLLHFRPSFSNPFSLHTSTHSLLLLLLLLLEPDQQRGRCQPRQSRFDTISSKTHSPPPPPPSSSLQSVGGGALSHLLTAVDVLKELHI